MWVVRARSEGAGFDVNEAEDEDQRDLFELAETCRDVRDREAM